MKSKKAQAGDLTKGEFALEYGPVPSADWPEPVGITLDDTAPCELNSIIDVNAYYYNFPIPEPKADILMEKDGRMAVIRKADQAEYEREGWKFKEVIRD